MKPMWLSLIDNSITGVIPCATARWCNIILLVHTTFRPQSRLAVVLVMSSCQNNRLYWYYQTFHWLCWPCKKSGFINMISTDAVELVGAKSSAQNLPNSSESNTSYLYHQCIFPMLNYVEMTTEISNYLTTLQMSVNSLYHFMLLTPKQI